MQKFTQFFIKNPNLQKMFFNLKIEMEKKIEKLN